MKQKYPLDHEFYSLNIEDLQNVANDILDRELDETEIKTIIGDVEENIPWYEIIANSIKSKIQHRDTSNSSQ